METIALVLFAVHILAFVAGGANGVVMPIIGSRMATATPETRETLWGVAGVVAKIGKYSMIALIATGLMVLWLRWNFAAPNVWFWVKMAGVAAMLVFIGFNEMNAKKARAGDMAAAARSKRFGMLTGIAFFVVVVSAVFAFNT